MMDVVSEIGPQFDVVPPGISDSHPQYATIVQARVTDLIENYAFMNSNDADGVFLSPIVHQALIDFVWSSENSVVFGEAFSEFFNSGMPLWLIANLGAAVRTPSYFFSTFIYMLHWQIFHYLDGVFIKSGGGVKPNFSGNTYYVHAQDLHNALFERVQDSFHGPNFVAYLQAWVKDGKWVNPVC